MVKILLGLAGGHRSEYGSHRGEEFDDRASDISSTTSGYRSGRGESFIDWLNNLLIDRLNNWLIDRLYNW